MSPKKEEGGGSPPRTLPLPRLMFVLRAHAGARQAVRAAASSSSTCTFVHIIWHCLPISFKPHRSFIHYEARTPDTPNGKPAGLSLNMIWRWPRKKKKEKEKKTHVYCLWVSVPLWQSPLQSISTKAFCSTWRDERRTSPFTLESHDTHTALLWNTTSAVPCSGVCSSSGVLRRPICLADHCLFDVAANVTFLFQSKTQQGVPSVWHSLHSSSPMPFCADHFTWQFARIFYTLILVNISACFFLNNMSLRWVSSVLKRKG